MTKLALLLCLLSPAVALAQGVCVEPNTDPVCSMDDARKDQSACTAENVELCQHALAESVVQTLTTEGHAEVASDCASFWTCYFAGREECEEDRWYANGHKDEPTLDNGVGGNVD